MTRNLDHISQRDLERLSAYLDGELSDQERARLEARLEEEGRLQGALEELQGAVGFMRRLPQVRPPRNYTLTPQVVGEREHGWSFPALQFATAVAALLLVAVVGLDAVTPAAGLMPSAPAEPAAAPLAMEAATTTQAPIEEGDAEAPEAMQAEPQTEAGAADQGRTASEVGTPAPAPTEEVAQEETRDLERSATTQDEADQKGFPSLVSELRRPGTLRVVELTLAGLVVLFGYLTYRSRPARK